MKQAILITAYKDLLFIERIFRRFDEDFLFFVHVDSKTPAGELAAFRAKCSRYSNVRQVTSAYRVNWGGLNHLKAILLLAEAALEAGAGYFHLITGQDYPVKSLAAFKALDTAKNYIESFLLPSSAWSSDRGGLDRIRYYRLHDVFDAKKRQQALLIRAIYELQKRLGIKRRLPGGLDFYGGSTYWSLSRECLQYVLDYTRDHPDFLAMFQHSFCPEEMYFQTIIMNSAHAERVVDDNLRYILWETRHGSLPAILDESDFDAVRSSGALFARKMQRPASDGLMERLGGLC